MGWTVGQNNGDGTGQLLEFDDDGTLVSTTPLTGLPIETSTITPDAAVVQLVQALADPDATLADIKNVAADIAPLLPDATP